MGQPKSPWGRTPLYSLQCIREYCAENPHYRRLESLLDAGWRDISSKDALSKVQQYTREGLLKRQREAHPFEAKIKKLLLKVLLKREERIDQLERVADRMLHVLPRK